MTPVFVTGATGMLGVRLVRRLLESGAPVRALSRGVAAADALLPRPVEIVHGDLLDADVLAEAMKGCAGVFHVAGAVSYRPGDAERLYETNVTGTRNVLSAALAAGVERVVQVSSTAAVGLSDEPLVLDESAPFDARLRRLPYMWMKHLAEVEALDAAARGLDVVIVNPSTFLGAGDVRMNSGALFRRIASGGVRAAPPGGNAVVALDDVVNGLFLAMERGASGRRYILSSENLTHRELLTRIARALGRPAVQRVLPRWTEPAVTAGAAVASALGGALTPQVVYFSFRHRWFDATRARDELGWSPRVPIEDAIAEAVQWYAAAGQLGPIASKAMPSPLDDPFRCEMGAR